MFFSAEALRELTLSGWHTQPVEPVPPLALQLLANKDKEYSASCLHAYIQSLPNAQEQYKILATLREEAQEHAKASMSGFRWWDICPGEHWLFAELERDQTQLLVSFCWKTVKKGAATGMFSQTDASWLFDKDAPRRSRFHFNQPEYHNLIAAFRAWLKQPIPDWPHWATPT